MARGDSISSELLPIWREMVELGEALPSEEMLAARLGTSRPAIREALIRMEANGLVSRHHGAGTYPNPAALDVPIRLDQAADFSDRLAAVGFVAVVEVLEAVVVDASEIDAPRLMAEPGDRVLRTTKRWRADGLVAVVAVDLVPLARRANAAEAIAQAATPVLELSGRFGFGKADWMFTWPTGVELDPATAELLELDPGCSVLCTEQLGVERHGHRVFRAIEYHRPNLVEYGLIRTVF